MAANRALSAALLVTLLCAGACSPRQQEEGVLRVPVVEPILAVDPFHVIGLTFATNVVYDSLIWYDAASKETYPLLAADDGAGDQQSEIEQ